jgi:hypothetical protein
VTVASVDTGSQTAVISTEHTLSTQTNPGIYVLVVDCNALVAGDVVEIRFKTKYASGGTERQARVYTLANVQEDVNFYSDAVPIDASVKVTLKQTAGTGRVFPWNLLRV